jgi:hypothetical protein
MRYLMVLMLSGSLLCPLDGARADQAHAHNGEAHRTWIKLSPATLAIGTAMLVTGARIFVVLAAGNTVLGGRIGTGLLAIYLAHVVAEGAIYGAGAGASAMMAEHGQAGSDPEGRPTLRPERLVNHVPSARLPLQLDRRYR